MKLSILQFSARLRCADVRYDSLTDLIHPFHGCIDSVYLYRLSNAYSILRMLCFFFHYFRPSLPKGLSCVSCGSKKGPCSRIPVAILIGLSPRIVARSAWALCKEQEHLFHKRNILSFCSWIQPKVMHMSPMFDITVRLQHKRDSIEGLLD